MVNVEIRVSVSVGVKVTVRVRVAGGLERDFIVDLLIEEHIITTAAAGSLLSFCSEWWLECLQEGGSSIYKRGLEYQQ